MRLTVLGSSPAWPNPGSAHAGYLVEAAGRLLLDCGPGVLSRLREAGRLDEVGAVAITHFHLDHWGDLVPWAWLAVHGGRDVRRPELWLPPGGRRELETFTSAWGRDGMFDAAFDVREFTAGRPFAAAELEVDPRRVQHYTLQAYGFRVADGGGRVLAYSGDCGPGDDLATLARGADLFVCEATLAHGANDTDPRGHLSAEEAIAVADGPLLLTHRPFELRAPDGVQVASDGLVREV